MLGTWKGTSLCTLRPSACHNEVVVYTITRSPDKKGGILWKADKIVNGVQENMGTLTCEYAPESHTLTCDMPEKGVWKLRVDGDAMKGTLLLPDGRLFRKVDVKRVR